MMVLPSGIRQTSVPWYEIITISSLDVPIFKDCALGNSIDEDGGNVHVADSEVILELVFSDFDSSDEDVAHSASLVVSLDVGDQIGEVLFRLNIESAVPLPIFGAIGDKAQSFTWGSGRDDI